MKIPLNKIKKIVLKLTPVDYVLIIFFVFLFAFVSIFLRRENSYITLRVKVTDQSPFFIKNQPPDEYAYAFLKGDTERNELGQVTSELLDVQTYRNTPAKLVVYVNIRTKAVYNPQKKQYSLKGIPVSFGQTFLFNFSNVKFEGMIVEYPGFQQDKRVAIATVSAQLRNDNRYFSDTYGVPDFIANAIKVGDRVMNSNGEQMAKVLAVDVRPSERTVFTQSGDPRLIFDPKLKDVFLTVELKTYIVQGKIYMFDYQPVSIGEFLPLDLPHINIIPTIIGISEYK
jgi:hypothetical protein